MPYIEQRGVYELWDLTRTYYRQTNDARQNEVPLYFCPSRRSPGKLSTDFDGLNLGQVHYPGALGDYAGCGASTGTATGYGDDGVFQVARITGPITLKGMDTIVPTTSWRAIVRIGDIRHGMSNTLLAGEKYVPPGAFGSFYKGGDSAAYNGDDSTPCTRAAGPGFRLAQSDADPYRRQFGGPHPGICQFAFADGSVHRVRSDVDTTTLGSLASRNDGLPVGNYE